MPDAFVAQTAYGADVCVKVVGQVKLKEILPEESALVLPNDFVHPLLLLQSPGLGSAPMETFPLQLVPVTVSFAPTGPLAEDGLTMENVGGPAGGVAVAVGVSSAGMAGEPEGDCAET